VCIVYQAIEDCIGDRRIADDLVPSFHRQLCADDGRAQAVTFFDHFEQINDKYGRLAGDFVLKKLARFLQSRIRRDEVFARYGGDEFCIIMPEAGLEETLKLGEYLRHEIEAHKFMCQRILPEAGLEEALRLGEYLRHEITVHEFALSGVEVQVTISLGCVQLGEEDGSVSELLARADAQLRVAKSAGGNRIGGSTSTHQ